jgi:hypothetical protein
VGQNRFAKLFNAQKYVISTTTFDIHKYTVDGMYRDRIWQLKELLLTMPESVVFIQKKVALAHAIREVVIRNFSTAMLTDAGADPMWVDQTFAGCPSILALLHDASGLIPQSNVRGALP